MKLNIFLSLVNFKYSIFAILFLSASTIFAFSLPEISQHLSVKVGLRILVLGAVAFIFARTTGIVVNQCIDWLIDKKNSRTLKRVLPANLVSLNFAWTFFLVCGFIFLVLCIMLGIFSLGLASLILMIVYPYMKRFTFLCHWGLGLVYALAIFTNFFVLAITGLSTSLRLLAILWGGSVGLVITANDIIYALQDIEFDRKEGVFSIPACYGKKKAIKIAQLSLSVSYLFYISSGFIGSLGKTFYISALIPLIMIIKVLRMYSNLDKTNQEEDGEFFWANMGIALSFLVSMIVFWISNL
ncbi:4-hydroxybenzoate octaprenyltransferase,prenyltransferase,Polyprenyltransferase (cytochrome oxidase assembly factor),putative 4-hydroxybenzoate polyprenyltransferase,UbiA prenyltransferase family [Chlamydia serpentis]|uniref:4-hydroxybenzoate octaprenyltransferase,prenyltransferase,Polyprenyltransfera se (Cytochrome oxidase assembly factor),putative 4-hydroxybenzoate polyprenyltransferase,UbiA prenyltransferase family n=1 Tax=Chlamydia serpentis TaxID=1967782 RepID=A0A2R8FAM7_9CHLA|nr:UbiA-like polyprenyltransferase [Chlamydia serpentis]SPN73411.1 4-hydroxybenzoate octaprenyltransferase,prenyltransferase,Polyprenyltransferase (cytochrome oxidase assembly factor),putative 4-hydroxybenzoate polyprenyltransferase,UbiA prenyltransferase family [Chlamydia serpentis]